MHTQISEDRLFSQCREFLAAGTGYVISGPSCRPRRARSQAVGEMLLRRVRQLYYGCGLHLERTAAEEEEVEMRIPRIVAVYALM